MKLKPEPIKDRSARQPFVIVGCIVKKDNKYLLVQEVGNGKNSIVRDKWNQPAGWLDFLEDITDGAVRETREETGLRVKLKGFLGVYAIIKNPHQRDTTRHAIKFIFAAKYNGGKIKFDEKEILDVKFFTFKEIVAMKNKLRDIDIIQEIKDYENNKIYPLEVVKHFTAMEMK